MTRDDYEKAKRIDLEIRTLTKALEHMRARYGDGAQLDIEDEATADAMREDLERSINAIEKQLQDLESEFARIGPVK